MKLAALFIPACLVAHPHLSEPESRTQFQAVPPF